MGAQILETGRTPFVDPRDGLAIPMVGGVASTADFLGYPGRVVECRMPPVGEPEWHEFQRRGGGTEEGGYGYAARDGTEVLGSPTVRDAIVPGQVDSDFRSYVQDMFGVDPRLHEVPDLAAFTLQSVREIIGRYDDYGPTAFYGWWAVDDLPSKNQLLAPNGQRWGNEKTAMRKIFDGNTDAYAGHVILRDPRVPANAVDGADARTVHDITDGELHELQNGAGHVWIKAGKFGLAGQGVTRGKNVGDILRFYDQLVNLGVNDASIILEQHLPGEGGSFTLIRRVDGKVVFSHVTKQLSVDGRRAGNIIHDVSGAAPRMVDLMNLTAQRLSDPSVVYPDKPGVYAFDTIDDAEGNPKANDVANRTTGTWTAAFQRLHLIDALNLPPQDTVTGIGKLYLPPKTTFADFMRALGTMKLTDFVNGRIVTVRQYFDGYGLDCAYLAYHATDQDRLSAIQQGVEHALCVAGIDHSSSRPL